VGLATVGLSGGVRDEATVLLLMVIPAAGNLAARLFTPRPEAAPEVEPFRLLFGRSQLVEGLADGSSFTEIREFKLESAGLEHAHYAS
jgi:hypothetical protein